MEWHEVLEIRFCIWNFFLKYSVRITNARILMKTDIFFQQAQFISREYHDLHLSSNSRHKTHSCAWWRLAYTVTVTDT